MDTLKSVLTIALMSPNTVFYCRAYVFLRTLYLHCLYHCTVYWHSYVHQVEIRVKEDAPAYPDSSVNSKWVETGLLPAGGNPASSSVSYHEKSASEGGCSAGRLDGCNIYNIKVRLPSLLLLLLLFSHNLLLSKI